ncbi:protein rolling stone-like [Phymastichus coffea]|uniref:protein rolling stone-like n=1 Tax=Phymastichus coffea TaxID=108790 RepID=UPI00273A77D7|nr:protein rolling stone-like [Phymastichus coffea]
MDTTQVPHRNTTRRQSYSSSESSSLDAAAHAATAIEDSHSSSPFCGRRAMVNKLWYRELARKWFSRKFEPPHARCFSEARCQDRLQPWYLAYRWLICLLWLSVVLCSVLEVGSVNPLGAWEKWPIYLTNWDLALGLTQALLGAALASKRWVLQRKPDFDASGMAYGKLEKVYWFLYVVTSSLAIGVTVTYWGLVHDAKIHHVDTLNILIHVSNSVFMLLDFCVAGVPFELRCFWWSPLVASFYLAFTVVYYVAGGLDKRGTHKIYNVLDWQKPARTLLVCFGGLSFLVVTHCLLYFLARFRDRRQKGRVVVSDKADFDRRKSDSCV